MVALISAALVAIVIISPSLLSWTALVLVGIVSVILMKAEFWLYAMIIVVYLNGLSSTYELLPRQTVFLLIDLLVFVITLKAVIALISKYRKPRWTPIDIPLMLLLFLIILSSIVNGIPIISLGVGLRFYLKFLLLFYAIINLNLSETFFKRAILLLVVLILLQVPVVLIQFLHYGYADIVSGTLGFQSSPVMLFVCAGGATLFLGFYIYHRRRPFIPLLSGILLIPPLLGTAVASLVICPLSLIFASRKALLQHKRALGWAIFTITVVMIIISLIGVKEYLDRAVAYLSKAVEHELNLGYDSWNTYSGLAPSRSLSIVLAYQYAQKDPIHFLLGYGPGSASYSAGIEFQGYMYDPDIPWRNSLSVGLIEWGGVGTFLYCLLLLLIWRMNQRCFYTTSSLYWKAVSFGFEGFWIVYLISIFYYVNWADNVSSLTIWFLAGAIFSHMKLSVGTTS